MSFTVDDAVTDIPATGDIQHRITVGPSTPLPLPPGRLSTTITGHVKVASSVDSDTGGFIGYPSDEAEDANYLAGGDEYGTLVATDNQLFKNFRPSDSLPEGLRGENVRITGGDLEASGQIRLIEGSFRTYAW